MIGRKREQHFLARGTQKQILIALIAANGLKKNHYSEELISAVMTGEDL